MTLRTRIAAVAGLAVAVAVVLAAVVVYVAVRSDLRGQVDSSLRQRAAGLVAPPPGALGTPEASDNGSVGGASKPNRNSGAGGPAPSDTAHAPPPGGGPGGAAGAPPNLPTSVAPARFGGPSGYVQFIDPTRRSQCSRVARLLAYNRHRQRRASNRRKRARAAARRSHRARHPPACAHARRRPPRRRAGRAAAHHGQPRAQPHPPDPAVGWRRRHRARGAAGGTRSTHRARPDRPLHAPHRTAHRRPRSQSSPGGERPRRARAPRSLIQRHARAGSSAPPPPSAT